MAQRIKTVAVLGSGVMGSGIAAHLAGVGLRTYLLDIVPPEFTEADQKKGLTQDDPAFRNKFALSNIAAAKKSKPPVFYNPADAEFITAGNFDDDLDKIAECDWVVEAVIERLDIKQQLFAKLDAIRKPGCLITSNTSGLSIEGMCQGRTEDFRKNFFVTHFFNPVRFMRLLELVPGKDTDLDAMNAFAKFGADVLGKGIVYGNDTPNFIANRIGTYGLMYTLHAMIEQGFTVGEIDALFGPASGRPKSAVFRTADLVGLDTLAHVAQNCYDSLTEDECRDTFKMPQFVNDMIEKGWLGSKTKGGFYKKIDGKICVLDYNTMEYKPKESVRADSIGAARGISDVGERVKKLVNGDDRFAKLAWESTARTLIYAANRLGEIADDVFNCDRAMRWGFGWELGPFETWDAIGVPQSVERMKAEGMPVPEIVTDMLAKGVTSFYGGTAVKPLFFDVQKKEEAPMEVDPRYITLAALKEKDKVLEKNNGATLYDMDDGVMLLEFHTKMNAVDDDIIAAMHSAINKAEDEGWNGLVIGNESKEAFSAGANIFAVMMAIQMGQWEQLEKMIDSFQQATLRMRQSDIPVVTAPAGLALGGGAEIAMGGDAMRPAAELYMGLVELGVGLIPAGGGCLEMLERFMAGAPDDPSFNPLPLIQGAFMNIGMAKVCVGAEEGRTFSMLRPHDQITLNPELLFHNAKETVLGMARAGYRQPRPAKFRLPGANGYTAIQWGLDGMARGGQITQHEFKIAGMLARVLCGGDTSMRVKVGQQHILDLEREVFLKLCGEPKSQERIQHMLTKNKPLRN